MGAKIGNNAKESECVTMEMQLNIIWIPFLVPFVMAGRSFLLHEDFGMAFADLVSKKTIIITIIVLFICLFVQLAFLNS